MALKDQALHLVQGPAFTAENYSVAWNQLVGRYENKKLIADTYFRQLLGLKNSSKEDVGELRQFINTFCSNVNALKALNIEQPLEGIILPLLLVEGLDSRTRLEWQMKQADKGFPSLKELTALMEEKCLILETLKPSANIANVKGRVGTNSEVVSWKLPTDMIYANPGFAYSEYVHVLVAAELFFHLLV